MKIIKERKEVTKGCAQLFVGRTGINGGEMLQLIVSPKTHKEGSKLGRYPPTHESNYM